MKTEIIKINPLKPKKEKILKAAKIIKKGGLVVFPTDTLYGLGGNALNKNVVKKIFALKKRPLNKPISINIAYKKDLKKYVKKIPLPAKKMIKEFWPGALTIIFEKSNIVPDQLTGGSPYIGIRIPDNKIALALIKKSGYPITSPSANLTGKKPPSNAKEAKKYFLNKIEMIIDGDITDPPAGGNKASTIIDITKEKPVIIREGIISVKIINKHLK